ncbi:LAGLIDADG family homing endonuclease [Deinococcus sp. QL22]|uniref:LAGLIDADG family homing endonuclease n=1 Tax=Deinococcus sp. QL22 TaxID=2939437 RepID=UPI0020171A6E|nr:LAGLIDADG family homing endonuclease [Deinococcus sp. QL22]UQN06312.1 LAGLIDADG family homing endonuclease [Deinococcus sp. QL22]
MPRILVQDGQPMSKRTEFRRRAAAGMTQPVFRYPFNEHFFDELAAPGAWLLGLIWSDGNLSRNSVEVVSKDRELMDEVAALIQQPGGVRPKNGGQVWRVVFSSPHTASVLKGLGLTPRKSLIVPWPELPAKLYGPFVRGLIDGDGSVLLSQRRTGQQVPDLTVSMTGASLTLMTGLRDWLSSQGITFNWNVKKSGWNEQNPVYKITVTGQASLRVLYGLLYDGGPTLSRKHDAYLLWMQTPRVRSGRPSRPLLPAD